MSQYIVFFIKYSDELIIVLPNDTAYKFVYLKQGGC